MPPRIVAADARHAGPKGEALKEADGRASRHVSVIDTRTRTRRLVAIQRPESTPPRPPSRWPRSVGLKSRRLIACRATGRAASAPEASSAPASRCRVCRQSVRLAEVEQTPKAAGKRGHDSQNRAELNEDLEAVWRPRLPIASSSKPNQSAGQDQVPRRRDRQQNSVSPSTRPMIAAKSASY